MVSVELDLLVNRLINKVTLTGGPGMKRKEKKEGKKEFSPMVVGEQRCGGGEHQCGGGASVWLGEWGCGGGASVWWGEHRCGGGALVWCGSIGVVSVSPKPADRTIPSMGEGGTWRRTLVDCYVSVDKEFISVLSPPPSLHL